MTESLFYTPELTQHCKLTILQYKIKIKFKNEMILNAKDEVPSWDILGNPILFSWPLSMSRLESYVTANFAKTEKYLLTIKVEKHWSYLIVFSGLWKKWEVTVTQNIFQNAVTSLPELPFMPYIVMITTSALSSDVITFQGEFTYQVEETQPGIHGIRKIC